jgi:hypothetical protein
MQIKPADLETFEAYKKAMRAAAAQIKDNTPFCLYTDVQLPDSTKKVHTLKPFLVVGSVMNVITPMLKNLKGGRKIICSGHCSLEGGKISLEAKTGKLEHGHLKSQAMIFKDVLGKEILFPSANAAKDPHAAGAAGAAGAAATPQKPAPQPPKLTQAALHWDGVRTTVDNKIKELKQAVKAHYAKSDPDLLKEIDKNMAKLDKILDKLDHRLTDSLKAGAAVPEAARPAELRKTQAILNEYKRTVQSEPLIAHIDRNPFGVKTNLKQSIMDSLTQAEKSMA